MLAGRPHEAAGNGSPRWMAADPRERVHRTRPTGQLARRLRSLLGAVSHALSLRIECVDHDIGLSTARALADGTMLADAFWIECDLAELSPGEPHYDVAPGGDAEML